MFARKSVIRENMSPEKMRAELLKNKIAIIFEAYDIDKTVV